MIVFAITTKVLLCHLFIAKLQKLRNYSMYTIPLLTHLSVVRFNKSVYDIPQIYNRQALIKIFKIFRLISLALFLVHETSDITKTILANKRAYYGVLSNGNHMENLSNLCCSHNDVKVYIFSLYHLFYRILKKKGIFFRGTLDNNVITQKAIASYP